MIDVIGLLSDDDFQVHSSIVLTYDLHLPLYDGWVRRALASAGATTQIVFADIRSYEEELAALPVTRHCGQAYSVTPVSQTGSFHPKVYLLLGHKGGRLILGSGNASIGGLLRNAELFGRFDFSVESKEGPHPAFKQILELVQTLAKCAPDVVARQLELAIARSPWLKLTPKGDGRRVLIGGPGRQPLLDQIRQELGTRQATRVWAVSSSFDRKLKALQELACMSKGGRVHVVVQPEQAMVDGAAVKRLGRLVDWRTFVDPYPPEKKKRRDVRLHAKLLVFECGADELAVFGSANASAPALVDAENCEIAVALWRPTGTTVKELGLGASLKGADASPVLVEAKWKKDTDADTAGPNPCVLVGAVPHPGRIDLTLVRGKVPDGAALELSEAPFHPCLVRVPAGADKGFAQAAIEDFPDGARVCRLLDHGAQPISNYVGLTWPVVAQRGSSHGLPVRAEAAIAAMQDGVVLGTVLFELLDHLGDFEVVLSGPHVKTEGDETPDEDPSIQVERPAASFYTNAIPGSSAGNVWAGDRTDLDLLAALIQPLTPAQTIKKPSLDTDEDDTAVAEEQERRELDEPGKAVGQTPQAQDALASRARLERAARRLASRLDRAAAAAEELLNTSETIAEIPPQSLARQIWMSHIGAFLAGRSSPTSDGKPVRCVAPSDFAHYVVRLCRSLAGGKTGGLLRLVPESAWAGPDGETLRSGLAFLWTCAIWAAAHYSETPPDEPADLSEVLVALVVARFVAAIRPRCDSPDMSELARRLPAAAAIPPEKLQSWCERVDELATRIRSIEGTPPASSPKGEADEGDLVFNKVLGVTVVGRNDGNKLWLVDLSRTDGRVVRVFRALDVAALETPMWMWFAMTHNPEWLREHLFDLRNEEQD